MFDSSVGSNSNELAALKLWDIERARDGLSQIRITRGKGGKDRYVPISDRALNAVDVYLAECRPALENFHSDDTLFLDTQGYPSKKINFLTWLKSIC